MSDEDWGNYSYDIYSRGLGNYDWKTQPEPKPRQPKRDISKDPKVILKPLDGVFFEPALMDDLVVRVSIPQLIRGEVPLFPGVILYGPPGTGKSEFQKAVRKVYENAGAYAKEISSSSVNTCWVSGFAKNLEKHLQQAAEEGRSRKLPSFLSFDEGSIFIQSASTGASSVSKHYQEAIDVFKSYLGNDIGKWLVVAISTNTLPVDFEEAMIRDGRLTSFLIDRPSKSQIARMWKYFSGKYDTLKLKDSQAFKLAEISANESGAMIEQFCRTYVAYRRQQVLHDHGHASLLDAIKEGDNVPEAEVTRSITFDVFYNDLAKALELKRARNGSGKSEAKGTGRIGF